MPRCTTSLSDSFAFTRGASLLKTSKISSNTSFKNKLRRRFGGCNLSVWLLAGGTLLLPSEV